MKSRTTQSIYFIYSPLFRSPDSEISVRPSLINFFLGSFLSLPHEIFFCGQLQDVENKRVEMSSKKKTKSIPEWESLSFKSPENVFIITKEP